MSTVKTQISVKASGDGLVKESEWLTTLLTNASAPSLGAEKRHIATGVNMIVVPTGAQAITIQPPAESLATLRLPGVSGATGMALRTGFASHNPIATGVTGILIDTDRAELIYIHWG